MADAKHAKKTNDQPRAALLANNRIPVIKIKVQNTHSCGKTAATLSCHLFADFTHAHLFPLSADPFSTARFSCWMRTITRECGSRRWHRSGKHCERFQKCMACRTAAAANATPDANENGLTIQKPRRREPKIARMCWFYRRDSDCSTFAKSIVS